MGTLPTILLLTLTLSAQPTPENPSLPDPTGPFPIGRLTLLCDDPTRIEPLDPNSAPRRILADIWYPAEPSTSQPAPYLDLDTFERALSVDRLKTHLGSAYHPIKAGRITTHARLQPPFAKSLRRAPLLLFSPGGGMIRELYTAQLEDLASHGYIVAALNHTYDAFLTAFPDGTHIAHDSRRWPTIPSLEGEANLNQLEWHTADILTVLTRLNATQTPIAGHLDLTRIGAFGHSFGGVAAAHACQKDQRIKACLNQDGAMGMKPYYPDPRGWGMNQPFLLLERPPNRDPLTASDLSAMKMTRERAHDFIRQLNAGRDRILHSSGRGAYRILLRRNLTTHLDFSDLPLLSANTTAERTQRLHVLALVRRYTLAFFDRHVKGIPAPLLDRPPADEFLESIEKFAPAKRPN